MTFSPIYSRQLLSLQNFGGTATEVNGGPDHYVIMTATASYGGLTAAQFALSDYNGAVMLAGNMASTGPTSLLFTDLRLSWAAGNAIVLQTFLGNIDFTLHGYQLTPP